MNFLNTTGLTALWLRAVLLVSTEVAKLSRVYAAIIHTHAISDVVGLQNELDAKADLDSPIFIGTPEAPTAEQSDDEESEQIATVGYVNTKMANGLTVADNVYAKKSQIATVNGASLIGGGDIQIIAYSGDTITVDANVSSSSINPIQSSGVYRAIEGGFWQS